MKLILSGVASDALPGTLDLPKVDTRRGWTADNQCCIFSVMVNGVHQQTVTTDLNWVKACQIEVQADLGVLTWSVQSNDPILSASIAWLQLLRRDRSRKMVSGLRVYGRTKIHDPFVCIDVAENAGKFSSHRFFTHSLCEAMWSSVVAEKEVKASAENLRLLSRAVRPFESNLSIEIHDDLDWSIKWMTQRQYDYLAGLHNVGQIVTSEPLRSQLRSNMLEAGKASWHLLPLGRLDHLIRERSLPSG